MNTHNRRLVSRLAVAGTLVAIVAALSGDRSLRAQSRRGAVPQLSTISEASFASKILHLHPNGPVILSSAGPTCR